MEVFGKGNLLTRARQLPPDFLDALFALRKLPAIGKIGVYGLLAGSDLISAATPGWRGRGGTDEA